MTGLIRAVIVTAVLTCSLTVNVGMYIAYAKPQVAYQDSVQGMLEALPVTKRK